VLKFTPLEVKFEQIINQPGVYAFYYFEFFLLQAFLIELHLIIPYNSQILSASLVEIDLIAQLHLHEEDVLVELLKGFFEILYKHYSINNGIE
jgi:hypothetical protein